MNEIVTRMVDTQMLLFLYMLCGFTVSRLNLIRDSNRSALVRLLMDVAMPMQGGPEAEWRAWHESNVRPLASEANTLSPELQARGAKNSISGGFRTALAGRAGATRRRAAIASRRSCGEVAARGRAAATLGPRFASCLIPG